jgi:uncharacterized protein
MKRIAIVATLIVAVIAAGCVSRNKSGSQTVSESNPGNPQQASVASTVAPSPTLTARIGYVTDSANVMDQSSRNHLETTLASFKQHAKIDFAVVTVESTGTKSVRDYSLELARQRKSNTGHTSGGVLLLVAVNDHHWHIQVTRNLESTLTNEVLVTLSKPMRDSFMQKRYGEGIIQYVNAIISKLAEFNAS